jgi:hypothetical protein
MSEQAVALGRKAKSESTEASESTSDSNARREATGLVRLLGVSGQSVEKLRKMISISAAERASLEQIMAPLHVRRIVDYRTDVLKHFDALVADQAACDALLAEAEVMRATVMERFRQQRAEHATRERIARDAVKMSKQSDWDSE